MTLRHREAQHRFSYCVLSLDERLQLRRFRVHLELAVSSKCVFARRLACNTTEHNAIQQGVTAQAVVAMDATSCLASYVKSRNNLAAFLVDTLGIDGAFQTTHAIVKARCDDGNREWLSRDLGPIDNVVVELFARARFSTGFVPRLSAWVRRP